MGVFVVLAFFWSSFLLWKLIRLSSFKEEDMFDAFFNSLLGGLLFGRLIYVFLHFSEFGFNILKIVLVNGYPGFSLYGMYAGIIISLLLWTYVKKIKFTEIIDYFVPPAFLALAIGKLGSFFSGLEVGTKTKFILSVKYANMDGMRNITPLYESILFFILTLIAYRLLFEIRKERLKKGFTLYFLLWGQGLIYFLFDNIKQYHLYFINYSFNKMISIILLLTFSFYFVYYFRGLILGRVKDFKNLTIQYVKRSFKSIHSKAKKKDRRGAKKNNSSN